MGFGVFFFAMIALTPIYAPTFWYQLKDGYSAFSSDRAKLAIAVHLLMQSSLTIAFHFRELLAVSFRQTFGETRRVVARRWMALPILLLSVGVAILIGGSIRSTLVTSGLGNGEIVYRCFMGFYGLAFPAYVWICMIPTDGKRKPFRRSVVITTIAILVALPMFWNGFILQRMGWLIPGVGIVLLSRLLVQSSKDTVEGSTLPS